MPCWPSPHSRLRFRRFRFFQARCTRRLHRAAATPAALAHRRFATPAILRHLLPCHYTHILPSFHADAAIIYAFTPSQGRLFSSLSRHAPLLRHSFAAMPLIRRMRCCHFTLRYAEPRHIMLLLTVTTMPTPMRKHFRRFSRRAGAAVTANSADEATLYITLSRTPPFTFSPHASC